MLKRGTEEEKALAVKEMVKQGLYVFGGHHTMTTLVKLQQDELPPPYDTPSAKPASWYRWPALVIALPGPLRDYVKYLDICSEFDNEPIALVLGKHMVIQGWEDGLQGMQVGEKRQLVIPPELAYGKEGRGPIPQNATLTFDIEMISLKRPVTPAAAQ